MDDIFVTKLNRRKYKGIQGSYEVLNAEGKPVLKSNGKPWAGNTLSMGNYYGIIVGSGKYRNVKLGATWKDGYKIKFEPSKNQPPLC